MAASTEPRAYSVTSCPAAPTEMPRSVAMAGSRPAGRASLGMATKPAAANASRPIQGKRGMSRMGAACRKRTT